MSPIAFTWNGSEIVMCIATNAPKLPALRKNPTAALTIDTEVHPPKILLIRGRAELDVVDACEIAAVRALRGFRFEHPSVLHGEPAPEFLTGLLQLRHLVRLAVTGSFIVVAALTGMRLSELLGLEEDRLEPAPLEDGSDDSLLYVRGILVKTAGTPHGERVRWVAGIDGPDNHVRAARRIASSPPKQLFLLWSARRVTGRQISRSNARSNEDTSGVSGNS